MGTESEYQPEHRQVRQNKKGYISLDYFNLFWIFVMCSILGLLIETIYHFVVFGGYESRAGLVWGPFSPIYGCGACAFTIALNRFWDKNVLIIFVVSMLIGMTLEFCTSWLMQTCFGLVAWDYSGTFGNIDGRTNIAFGTMWGLLGTLWIRFILPFVLRLIAIIPFKWHIAFTTLLTIFLILDIAVTLTAIDRQYQRIRDIPATNIIQRLCDQFFPDDWMHARFQNTTMTADLDVDKDVVVTLYQRPPIKLAA